MKTPRNPADLTDRELSLEIARLNGYVEDARAQRRPLIAERQKRELRRSAQQKLDRLTPEEVAALQEVEATEPERL